LTERRLWRFRSDLAQSLIVKFLKLSSGIEVLLIG
jgi:hypothetical protein